MDIYDKSGPGARRFIRRLWFREDVRGSGVQEGARGSGVQEVFRRAGDQVVGRRSGPGGGQEVKC